ncbi:MAG: hypothetical protein IJG86_06055 [Clostridia bacterium]|nr:hypothetical protein [Clostridia bacterium]
MSSENLGAFFNALLSADAALSRLVLKFKERFICGWNTEVEGPDPLEDYGQWCEVMRKIDAVSASLKQAQKISESEFMRTLEVFRKERGLYGKTGQEEEVCYGRTKDQNHVF